MSTAASTKSETPTGHHVTTIATAHDATAAPPTMEAKNADAAAPAGNALLIIDAQVRSRGSRKEKEEEEEEEEGGEGRGEEAEEAGGGGRRRSLCSAVPRGRLAVVLRPGLLWVAPSPSTIHPHSPPILTTHHHSSP
jgi:hypothetical protein